jgi:hypothetical protein
VILLVTYDLKGPSGSYTDLFEALKAEDSWWHYIGSTWLIDTKEKSAEDFLDKIKAHFQKGDRVLITQVVNGYNGLLPQQAWNWLKNRGIHP